MLTRHYVGTRQQPESVDSFGVEGTSGTEVAGERINLEPKKMLEKYKFAVFRRQAIDNEEQLQITSFGAVRYDSQNQTKYHGQFDIENENKKFDLEHLKTKLYFYDNQEPTEESPHDDSQVDRKSTLPDVKPIKKELDGPEAELKKVKEPLPDLYDYSFVKQDSRFSKRAIPVHVQAGKSALPTNNFYFASEWQQWIRNDNRWRNMYRDKQVQPIQSKVKKAEGSIVLSVNSPLKSFDDIEEELREMEQEEGGEAVQEMTDTDQEDLAITNKTADSTPASAESKIITAFDYAKSFQLKLKKSGGKTTAFERLIQSKMDAELGLDSKGYKDYRKQVVDLNSLNRCDQLLYLESQILLNTDQLVAINKPYGLICPGEKRSESSAGVKLIDLMDDFAEIVFSKPTRLQRWNQTGVDRRQPESESSDDGKQEDKGDVEREEPEQQEERRLYPIHRLDRDCTGVLIFGKSQQAARRLHQLFQERKVQKVYLAITKGVPQPFQGQIDIPMEERMLDGKERMSLAPEIDERYRQLIKPSRNAKRALTNYRVLSESGNACLVELRPITGVKHQLRAHMGLGMRTPILGDHKYSDMKRIVPQKLPTDMLQRLHVRQSKARTVPMHLHCRQLVLPEFGRNGNDLYLQANLPHHFLQNLHSLKLRV